MDTGFILRRVEHMTPASFSARERLRYQAEKMLMRQFMLQKGTFLLPFYLSVQDMKVWLLAGRSFLAEFWEIAAQAKEGALLQAELAWTSARQLCLNQMEQELTEELEKEKILSQQLGRKVTLEGFHMFLSVLRPKARQDVRTFLWHLSNQLLGQFTDHLTGSHSKLALLAKLRRTTEPLVPQVVDAAIRFLLDEPHVEVRPSEVKTRRPVVNETSGLSSALINRAEAASASISKLLADATATCFCLDTSFTRARLLRSSMSVAQNMVETIYRTFIDRSKSFHLMDFDGSFFSAGEAITWAVQEMDNRAQRALYQIALDQRHNEEEPRGIPAAPGATVRGLFAEDQKRDQAEKQRT